MQITIRHAEPDDYIALHRISSGNRAIWGTLQMPWPPLENSRKRVAELPPGTYYLVACVDEEVVGALMLIPSMLPRRRHAADLAIAVRDDWRSRGVGSALMHAALDLADNWLNLLRIELNVWMDNEVAIALYTKFGFVIEGTHRCYVFRDGRYVDAYSMARIRCGAD